MRIAILGWGSLIWFPDSLDFKGKINPARDTYLGWKCDGPELPIEFARISKDGRLTLVINKDSKPVTTYYVESLDDDLVKAEQNLINRESPDRYKIVGSYNFNTNEIKRNKNGSSLDNNSLKKTLNDWNKDKNYDAVIWTDLCSNFKKETTLDPTEENLILYLKELKIFTDLKVLNNLITLKAISKFKNLNEVKEYIQKAPPQTQTEFRPSLEEIVNNWQLG